AVVLVRTARAERTRVPRPAGLLHALCRESAVRRTVRSRRHPAPRLPRRHWPAVQPDRDRAVRPRPIQCLGGRRHIRRSKRVDRRGELARARDAAQRSRRAGVDARLRLALPAAAESAVVLGARTGQRSLAAGAGGNHDRRAQVQRRRTPGLRTAETRRRRRRRARHRCEPRRLDRGIHRRSADAHSEWLHLGTVGRLRLHALDGPVRRVSDLGGGRRDAREAPGGLRHRLVVALRSTRREPRNAREPLLPHAAHHAASSDVSADRDRRLLDLRRPLSEVSRSPLPSRARVRPEGDLQAAPLLHVLILFFTHYVPPEVNAPANRTFEHCQAWVNAGHEVHVVTCVPSHPLGRPFAGFRRCWYRHDVADGIHVHRVWTHLAPNRAVFWRIVNYLSFVPTAVWRAWRLGRFDVAVGTSPQFFCAVATWLYTRVRPTPWVF